MHLCGIFNTYWRRHRGVKCRMRWAPTRTVTVFDRTVKRIRTCRDSRGESAAVPPYNTGITTNDPEKIEQALGNVCFGIKPGEMRTCDGRAISTSSTRALRIRTRDVNTLTSNVTLHRKMQGLLHRELEKSSQRRPPPPLKSRNFSRTTAVTIECIVI